MNFSVSNPLSPSGIKDNLDLDEVIPLVKKDDSDNAVHVQHGPLSGHTVKVGDGAERNRNLSLGESAKSFFKALAEPFLALGRGIKDFFSTESREARLDKAYAARNAQMVQALATPMPNSVLGEKGVLDKLEAHAKSLHSPLSRQQIQELVATGERLVVALRDAPNGNSPLSIKGGDGQQYTVDSGIHTTRALSWYMMAMGALQDVRRDEAQLNTPSSMPTNGSFLMKDPGNRIYQFMAQAPTSCSRMSTHFNERSSTDSQHKIIGLFPTGKPAQRGIEDFRGMLPGQGGSILFDKLHGRNGSQELFVKFEHAGCPPYFGGLENHEGVGTAISRFFPALSRNLGHALSFLKTRGGEEPIEGRRQEHIYKGLLKKTVYTPFMNLVKLAEQQGMNLGQDAKSIAKSIHKTGLPVVHKMLDLIAKQALEQGKPDVAKEAETVRQKVGEALLELGWQSDRFDIERRGGEVHIELDPDQRI